MCATSDYYYTRLLRLKWCLLLGVSGHATLVFCRSYVFLKNCGHGSILLRHAWLEHRSLTSIDGKRVLSVLDEYITDTGGLPR